jgi:hypothetical protein
VLFQDGSVQALAQFDIDPSVQAIYNDNWLPILLQ